MFRSDNKQDSCLLYYITYYIHSGQQNCNSPDKNCELNKSCCIFPSGKGKQLSIPLGLGFGVMFSWIDSRDGTYDTMMADTDTNTDTSFWMSSIPDTIMTDTDTDTRYFFYLLVTILRIV